MVNTKAWRSILKKKNTKEQLFSFFMSNYIISDKSFDVQDRVLIDWVVGPGEN